MILQRPAGQLAQLLDDGVLRGPVRRRLGVHEERPCTGGTALPGSTAWPRRSAGRGVGAGGRRRQAPIDVARLAARAGVALRARLLPGLALVPARPGERARERRDTDDHGRGGAAGGRHDLPAPGPRRRVAAAGHAAAAARRRAGARPSSLRVRAAPGLLRPLPVGAAAGDGRTVGRPAGQHEQAERRPRRRLAVKFVRRWRGAQRGQGACYRPEHHRGVAGLAGQQRIEVSLALRCGTLDRQQAVWHFIVRNAKIPQSVTPAREVTPAGPSSVSSLLRPRCAITRTLPGVFPSMLGDHIGVQPGDDPQHDHLGLQRRQLGEQRDRGLRGEVVQRDLGRIGRPRHLGRR